MLVYKVKGPHRRRVRGVRRSGGDRRMDNRRKGLEDATHHGINHRVTARRAKTRRLSIDRRHMERAIFVPIAKD